MTTKPEMTLENVCFRYDGSQEAVECIQLINKKYEVEFGGVLTQKYWITKDGHPVSTIRKPSSYNLISPSDYLLLLSAPESQAHLLREKDLIVGNRFECIETFHDGRINYIEGCIYPCNRDGGISDHRGYHIKITTDFLNRHFKLVSQPPVMEGKEESRFSGVEKILEDAFEKVAFRVPYDGSNKFYDDNDLDSFARLKKVLLPELSSLQSEVEQLKGALQELVDIQNGPPLEQHKKEWQEIIEKCYSILSK